jgi:hypothetical protein
VHDPAPGRAVTVADEFSVEHRLAPRCCARAGWRARRAHDPAGLGGADFGRGGEPQHHAGGAGGTGRERELAACHRVERLRLPPQLSDDGAERVAGKAVGGGAQRHFGIVSAYRDDEARIKPKLDKTRHRHCAGLAAGKVLRDPEHEATVLRDAPDERERKAGRRCTLPPLICKHLVQRAEREPALQGVIHSRMSKRHAFAEPLIIDRLKASDRASQGRECFVAGANHLRRSLISKSPHALHSGNYVTKLDCSCYVLIKARSKKESTGVFWTEILEQDQ